MASGMAEAPAISRDRDPLSLFGDWVVAAEKSEPGDHNAMALATVDPQGMPNVRMVLMKDCDSCGPLFYTNLGSTKARELSQQARAACVFHWKSLGRQVRMRGTVAGISDDVADAYFATRERGSQVGAWVSMQSQVMEDRHVLQNRVVCVENDYADRAIPRPPHWSGFRLIALEIEFWAERPWRLHERLLFRRPHPEGRWESQWLYP